MGESASRKLAYLGILEKSSGATLGRTLLKCRVLLSKLLRLRSSVSSLPRNKRLLGLLCGGVAAIPHQILHSFLPFDPVRKCSTAEWLSRDKESPQQSSQK